MRLLRTSPLDDGSFSVEEFHDDAIPPYAILSHTWGEQEVTLQDMQNGRAQEKKGYHKIVGCCAYARANGFSYVWIDTCCIDKTSSAELSEAINSMYRWYQDADVCYAYLADVSTDQTREMKDSRWFTRGWTLQELIAPSKIVFLHSCWRKLGTKRDMAETISRVTGIPPGVLKGTTEVDTVTIAQRMSWASKRKTSRIEDQAYCLMGLFGINMSLIYGEKEKAFIRLQEEILAVSDDLSIFIWKAEDQTNEGLLATSPKAFEYSGDIIHGSNPATISGTPLMVSSKGIHLELPFVAVGHSGLGLALLDYATSKKPHRRMVGIFIRDITLNFQNFKRVWCHRFDLIEIRLFRPAQYPFTNMRFQRTRVMRGKTTSPRSSPRSRRSESPRGEIVDHDNLRMFDSERWPGETYEYQRQALESRSVLATSPSDPSSTQQHTISDAAKAGDVILMRALLAAQPVSPEEKDRDERTPLSYAAESGHAGVAWLLLMLPMTNINSQDGRGRSPLSYAAEKGHVEIVWLFLARSDVRVDLSDNEGRTPLSYAARKGRKVIVDMILLRDKSNGESYDKQGRSPLSYASEHGHADVVKSLLAKSTAGLEKRDRFSLTPLCWATWHGYRKVVSLLLGRGADSEVEADYDLEAKDGPGRKLTPLWIAVIKGSSPITWLLLKHGVNTGALNEKSITPLVWAVLTEQFGIAKMLLETSRDFQSIQTHTAKSKKFFMWAVENGHCRLSESLLKNSTGQSVAEMQDENGCTPLHLAAANHHLDIVVMILQHAANAESQAGGKHVPLANDSEKQALVELLRQCSKVQYQRDSATKLAELLFKFGVTESREDHTSPLDLWGKWLDDQQNSLPSAIVCPGDADDGGESA